MDLPCSELTTSIFVNQAKTLAETLQKTAKNGKVEIAVIEGTELDRLHFGGIYGVGKGATCPPALVHLTYTPNAKPIKTVALVGKGIVYDTGGLSLKNTAGMCGMKHDMGSC